MHMKPSNIHNTKSTTLNYKSWQSWNVHLSNYEVKIHFFWEKKLNTFVVLYIYLGSLWEWSPQRSVKSTIKTKWINQNKPEQNKIQNTKIQKLKSGCKDFSLISNQQKSGLIKALGVIIVYLCEKKNTLDIYFRASLTCKNSYCTDKHDPNTLEMLIFLQQFDQPKPPKAPHDKVLHVLVVYKVPIEFLSKNTGSIHYMMSGKEK